VQHRWRWLTPAEGGLQCGVVRRHQSRDRLVGEADDNGKSMKAASNWLADTWWEMSHVVHHHILGHM
jgi:hypothetical protein